MRHIMDEKRTNRKKRNLVRLIVRSLMVIVVFVALLPATLYIPAVQNFVKTIVGSHRLWSGNRQVHIAVPRKSVGREFLDYRPEQGYNGIRR